MTKLTGAAVVSPHLVEGFIKPFFSLINILIHIYE